MPPDIETAEVEREKPRFTAERVRAFLARAAQAFGSHPFKPHRLFKNGHAQTLAAYAWPRGFRFYSERDEERFFEVEPGVQVLAHCRWHTKRAGHPTIVIWHGIEGSTGSNYMLAIAEKGVRAGFNIIRVNLRNCGGTEHLTPTLYHGGLSEDLRAVVKELIEVDQISTMFLVGFSLGGNLVLKLAGEYGDDPPPQVLAVCAVSPSVDLTASAELILKRSNWIYQQDFVRRLKNRIRTKHKMFPELYDISDLEKVRTLKQFDERFTAPAHGFADADDYYYRSSSVRVIDRIRIPTLIIHAEDDPFIPFDPLRDRAVANNPYILLLGTEQGGHVAFISAKDESSANSSPVTRGASLLEEDRFWAENRVVEFCKLAVETL
jgi:predicted alpha/beta-fold hydrolase